MRIREALSADAPTLSRVARRAKASWGYPPAWLLEWDAILTISPDYIERHAVWVAELKGRIVGVGALEETATGFEIGHLWVLPEAQGLGVGRALLRRLIEVAREVGHATSVRVESDPNARAFYERMGAVYVGEAAAPVSGVARTLPVLRWTL